MSLKRLAPVLAVALLLLTAAVMIAGATGSQQVKVPQGSIVESPNAQRGVVDNGAPAIPDAPRPAPADPNAKFDDEFSADSASKYEPLASAPGTWVVRNNRLQQRGDENGDLSDYPAVLTVKGVNFADNTISAHAFGVAMPYGLVFRGSDAGYYRLSLFLEENAAAPMVFLEKVEGATTTKLAEVDPAVFAGYKNRKWQNIQVTAVGNRITASVDGTQVIDVTDNSFSSGWAGVWASADSRTQFDNVRVSNASANR